MHFLKRQFQLYLNSELGKLRQRLRSSSITLTLFVVTGILFVFALGFALFACYQLLTEVWFWQAWQAGLLIAVVLCLMVAGLLFKLFRQTEPAPAVTETPKTESAPEKPPTSDAESGLRLGEEVGRSIHRRYRENSLDLIMAAMALGVVSGARQGRRRPGRERKGRQPKRDSPEH